MTTASNSSLKVLRQLGSDAHCDAFLAEVRGFDAPMRVRVVKPELAQNAERMNRFIAEARLLTEVTSPGLLQVRSAGRMKDGQVYVLTDYAEGQPLAGEANLPLQQMVELGLPLCSALAALHEAGLVLGALDPREVLSTARGPLLDASLAPLSRAPGATPATDVRALAKLITALSGPGAVNDPYELAVRQGLGSATTAGELISALQSARKRWAKDPVGAAGPSVSAVVESVTIEEADLSGQQLGPYALQRVLGEGAMGRVYLGTHAQTGREAAIKVLKAEHAAQKDLVKRFIQEATAINAIKNEHIVEVYDFGEGPAANGIPRVYCVMEVLHGRPLADAMEEELFNLQRTCRIIQQVARALGAAHELGVVHRDIKPENIYLHEREGEPECVKVLDFGVAKLLKPLANLSTSNTQKGVVIGTPEYMAPEQALGISTDSRVDLYAAGLVLYELLAGGAPFAGATFGKLVVEITTKRPPPLPETNPAGERIPGGLIAIVGRCLEKKPEDRFSSAAELMAALEPYVTGAAMAGPGEVDEAALRAAVRPSRTPRLVAAFGLALVLGAIGFYVVRTPAAEAVAASTVSLEVTSVPAGAKVIRADTGQVLGVTPLKLQTERLDAPMPVRLELAGHAAAERQLPLTSDLSLAVELLPEAKPPQ